MSKRLITYKGVTDTISGHARRAGINRQTVVSRLNHEWSIEDALSVRPLTRGEVFSKYRDGVRQRAADGKRRAAFYQHGSNAPVTLPTIKAMTED